MIFYLIFLVLPALIVILGYEWIKVVRSNVCHRKEIRKAEKYKASKKEKSSLKAQVKMFSLYLKVNKRKSANS